MAGSHTVMLIAVSASAIDGVRPHRVRGAEAPRVGAGEPGLREAGVEPGDPGSRLRRVTFIQNRVLRSSRDNHPDTNGFIRRPGAGIARRQVCTVLPGGEGDQSVVHGPASDPELAEHIRDSSGHIGSEE